MVTERDGGENLKAEERGPREKSECPSQVVLGEGMVKKQNRRRWRM